MRDLNSEIRRLVSWFAMAALLWSGLIAGIAYWNFLHIHEQSLALASTEAIAHFNKDRAIRLWGTSHGGIYVPTSEATPPNPRLSHIPERDITTPSGKPLTLMNPASMIRQMMNEYEKLYGVKGKITAFPDKLFYQGNMPDAWEIASMQSFQKGANEVKEIVEINGLPHMRYMRPMFVEQGCLKCHGAQDYKIGDLIGGVGVAVSMQPYLDSDQQEMKVHGFSFFLIWLVGLGVMAFTFFRAKHHARELFAAQEHYYLEQKLQHSKKMETIRTLVGGIAHTFNNKLAAIAGNTFLIRNELSGSPELSKRLNNIDGLNLESSELIRKLLTFTENEQTQISKLSINSCIQGMLKENSSIIPEDITLHVDLTKEVLTIEGESSRLNVALLKVLENACEAVAVTLHPMIQIKSGLFEADHEFKERHTHLEEMLFAHLEIKDNGAGITELNLDRVFEPFFTTKGIDQSSDGLGLSLAYGIIRSHHGVIEITSSINFGTSVHIYLPLSETPELNSKA